ncbi:MAG TPA: Sua5/YciO/YrdC/YwlC family protein [Gammaproteobacteria bacterium]
MSDLKATIDILHRGGIIAYPTEAVYGLGCDPDNEVAVLRLLEIKQRPLEKGLILIAADPAQLEPYIVPSVFAQYPDVLASWPGPNTWLLPCKADTPLWLKGIHDTLAVRITAHPLCADLCRAFGKPLVSTSANPNGFEPARTAAEVRSMFSDNQLDLVVEGETGGLATVSSIRDARTGRQIR